MNKIEKMFNKVNKEIYYPTLDLETEFWTKCEDSEFEEKYKFIKKSFTEILTELNKESITINEFIDKVNGNDDFTDTMYKTLKRRLEYIGHKRKLIKDYIDINENGYKNWKLNK